MDIVTLLRVMKADNEASYLYSGLTYVYDRYVLGCIEYGVGVFAVRCTSLLIDCW